MHQLRYIDEIKLVNEIEGMPDASQPKIDNKELSLGKALVENFQMKNLIQASILMPTLSNWSN